MTIQGISESVSELIQPDVLQELSQTLSGCFQKLNEVICSIVSTCGVKRLEDYGRRKAVLFRKIRGVVFRRAGFLSLSVAHYQCPRKWGVQSCSSTGVYVVSQSPSCAYFGG